MHAWRTRVNTQHPGSTSTLNTQHPPMTQHSTLSPPPRVNTQHSNTHCRGRVRCGAALWPPSARGGRAAVEPRCSWLAAGPAAQPPCHAQVRRSRRRAAAGGRERRARRALSTASRGLPEELRSEAAAWRQRAARARRRRIGHLRCWGEAHTGGGKWGGRWAAELTLLGLCVCFRCVWCPEGVAPCVMRGLFRR